MLVSQLIQQFTLDTAAPLISDFEIRGVCPLSTAGPEDLSFLSNPRYKDQVTQSKAGVLLVREHIPDSQAIQLLCKDPYLTLARIMQVLYPEPDFPESVHPSAVVDPSARVGKGVYIGPHCVVERDVRLDDYCVLVSGVSIGPESQLGKGVRLYPNVVLYRRTQLGDNVRIHANSTIGGDGFGYAQDGATHVKVPQIARVRIEDNVEIGCNTCIDRGALDDTVIGAGSIIDNQVQIAHGVKVGKGAILVSQTGISGSAQIGNSTVLAGKVGVVGHVTIGDQILVMGDSVVTKDLDKPGRYAGNPAVPHMQYQRQLAQIRSLKSLKDRVKALEELFRKQS